jgi:tetratricopeptide (TPR) repeat protein
MAQGPKSLQDLIQNRQQSGFVGRVGQIAQYQENLGLPVDDDRRRFLFNIHGDAGVGKTYLTRQLRQLAVSRGALTAYVDETADDATAAMNAIAAQFAEAGSRLGGFEKRAEAYRRRRQELESDPKAPDDIAAFLTKTAVTIGLAAARDIPVAGSLLAPVDPGRAADQVNRARAYLARRVSDHADVRLLLSPADELTPVFVAELNRIAGARPVALFIDTYERTAMVLDYWLRRLYDGRYGGLPMTLVTTVSGQKPLDPNLWGDYLPVTADVGLEPFSAAEARQFLTSKGIHDEGMIEVILSLSGRLPLWLATLAEARPGGIADIGDPAGDAVERFLKWEVDPARRRVAIAAALPRALNQDVLGEVAGTGEADELFGWLCGLPFIARRDESWAYHEVVRAAMLRLQQAQAPSEWTSRQLALARAHAKWAGDAAGADVNGWSAPRWIDHTREQVYHALCANPDANLRGALESAVQAAVFSSIRARQWADAIADAGRDTGHSGVRRWGQRLQDGIRNDDVTGYLTALINDAHLDHGSLAVALGQRGETLYLAGRYNEALADSNRVIQINPENTAATMRRIILLAHTARYDEAITEVNRIIEQDPGNFILTTLRGMIWVVAGRFDDGIADLDRAIEPTVEDTVITLRGIAYLQTGRHREALADLNRAIELGNSAVWILVYRGQAYSANGLYNEALADLDRAIELDPADARAFNARAAVYRLTKRYDEAIFDLTQLIQLDASPNPAALLGYRSLVHWEAGRNDEALSGLDRAVDINPNEALLRGSRAQVYKSMTWYDEALADLDCAIDLDPTISWLFQMRGEVLLEVSRGDEAISDLARAIELGPSTTDLHALRGLAYERADRHDEAVADLTRAIELGPDRTALRALRGRAYKAIARHDDAIADFTHVIAAEPAHASAIGGRILSYFETGRYDEAVADLTRLCQVADQPEPGWLERMRALIHLRAGRYDEALPDLNRVIELDPSDTKFLVYRGLAHCESGRYDEAIAELDHAVKLDPDMATAFECRAKVYKALGRYDEAIAEIDHAIKLDPNDGDYIAERAEIARLGGRSTDESTDLQALAVSS